MPTTHESPDAKYTGPDEFPIKEIPDTRWWSENFAAMFSSPGERVAVFYSIGRWHSDTSIWREVVLVSLPDGRVLHSQGYARNGTADAPASALSRYQIVQPGQEVRLSFDGPAFEAGLSDLIERGALRGTTKRCRVDLRFEADAPLWNMKGDSQEASTVAGSVHVDHIGKATGSIEYDDRTYPFTDGYSVRDHSRGVREISQYGGHNWISCAFPSGRAFYLYAMKSQGSSEIGMSNAAVAQDGELYPAEVVQTEFITSPDVAGQTQTIVLNSELGLMDVEVTEVLNTLVSSMVCPYETHPGATHHRPASLCFDESVLMRYNGEEAFGWAERGFANEPLA